MRILLYALGGLLLLSALGALYLYFRMKQYLTRPQDGVQGTTSDIIEEIDSYQEKTQ